MMRRTRFATRRSRLFAMTSTPPLQKPTLISIRPSSSTRISREHTRACWSFGVARRFPAALARVKRQVSARQFQLFDLHVLQGLPVRGVARAAGATVAAVYMAKSRVARLVRREINRLREFGS